MLTHHTETSANTLSATIAMLALYQEEQERVYQVVMDVLGDRQQPVRILLDVLESRARLT
jgi:predicted component of type VI protein secretion system